MSSTPLLDLVAGRGPGRRTVVQRAAAGRGERVVALAIVAALAWFALQAVWLALGKYFSIDEFQYAHAAWLVAHGGVPYRDFFEVHFPLVYQTLAPVFAFLGDDPRLVVLLRAGMLGFVALACLGAAATNRDRGLVAMLLAALFLLALPAFVTLATEIRPDSAAFALFVAALGVLRIERIGDRGSAFACGLLVAGSVWGSQKAAFYGAIFPAALALDLAGGARSAGGGRPLLRSPLAFVTGAVVGGSAIALYLTATRSWSAWWSWCFAWAAQHQRQYPGFGWRRYFDPIFLDSVWLFALAAVGLAATLRALLGRGREAHRDPDLLVVAALASTFGSYALQRAPYPYSLLPFLGFAAIFAARGAATLLRASNPPLLRVGAAAVLVAVLAVQSATLARFVGATNRAQLATLARVGELTAPDDPAYDNSGSYVSRPHAYRYFYTDSYLREALADTLAREVPAAIVESGAVLHLVDLRFDTLPASLREFLHEHFQPVDGDLALWGRRYRVPPDGALEASFLAVRDDRYFVSPPDALARGELRIDGAPVREPVFALAKGAHAISYRGTPGDVEILWLPRNGERWTPRRGLPPTFSRLF